MRTLLWIAFVATLVATSFVGCVSTRAKSKSMRAIWVSRYDYLTEDDIRGVVDNCEELGFDTILFQVRGNGTVFYRSEIEPWAEQLGWEDPGFDPLEVALEHAHERGLELHAWINVMPAWWGPTPPANPEHLYHTRPEWFWYDQDGRRQPLTKSFYVSLNPCLPAVRAYLVDVVDELVSNYDVDGVHLDYIRFPNEPPVVPESSTLDYPRDAASLSLYRAAGGEDPDLDPAHWDAWRTNAVTELVRDIRTRIRMRKPGVVLSAAVGADPELAATKHFQDAETWMREGLVDRVFPMNYTADPDLFEERFRFWKPWDGRVGVWMGVMMASGDVTVRDAQVQASERAFTGLCVFGYHALFESPNTTLSSSEDVEGRRSDSIADILRSRRH